MFSFRATDSFAKHSVRIRVLMSFLIQFNGCALKSVKYYNIYNQNCYNKPKTRSHLSIDCRQ